MLPCAFYRLNAARVLIAGCTSGVAAEVGPCMLPSVCQWLIPPTVLYYPAPPQAAKNIALAGVGSLLLLDPTPSTAESAACNFLVPADAGASERCEDYSACPCLATCSMHMPLHLMAHACMHASLCHVLCHPHSVAEASAATLREMNPLVKISALPGSLPAAPDSAFLRDFNVVLVTGAPLSTLLAYDRRGALPG